MRTDGSRKLQGPEPPSPAPSPSLGTCHPRQGAGAPETLSGDATGPGGAGYVRLELTLKGDRIAEAIWESNGCPAAHKAANGIASFLKGRTLEQASKIEPDDLLILIGGLPDGKGHYATIAVDALQNALRSRTDSSPKGNDHGSGEQESVRAENQ